MSNPAKNPPRSFHYDANYKNFQTDLYASIRRDACLGEDLGQTSWITAHEQDRSLEWLRLGPGKSLLDVACGSGGPALRIAARTGCDIVGVDLHEAGVSAGRELAAERGLSDRARFEVADASKQLPFPDGTFDAITCIDAINHLPDRPATIREWARLLKAGGRLLFTNPTVVTGPLTGEELRVRSSIGFFLFVPAGYDQQVIEECGLRLVICEDATENMATMAERRRSARAKCEARLQEIEGDASYNGQQEFFEVASRIARERRLSRFLFVAEKAG
jgi:cyclopropane fatty-acyl-phospholipid synthase-like methyltransferase